LQDGWRFIKAVEDERKRREQQRTVKVKIEQQKSANGMK
jgi:hypothetical protein